MGVCNCVSKVEEQTILDLSSPQYKQDQEILESDLTEIIYHPFETTAQALIRSYFVRKHNKHRKKKQINEQVEPKVDLRQFIPQEIQEILGKCSAFDYAATGEIHNLPDDSIFIGKQNDSEDLTSGHLITKDSYYKGTMKNMKYEGKGILIYSNGNTYNGSFKNGVFHGKGDFDSINDRKRYSGNWDSGQCSGRGIVFAPDGSICKANFSNGIKSGSGCINYKDGSSYTGKFKQDQFNGIGKFTWSDGRVYEGHWKDGKIHGRGKLSFPDGRTYEGEFANDLKEGFGTYVWPDGKKFEGTWKAGKQHGIGLLTESDGKQKKGEWKQGKRIKWINS